ncbi:MAG: copper resistance protein B [Alphaproteobacteria bacterium]|nr:copper resistance protein B [Alphaproteobacteria bacterium]
MVWAAAGPSPVRAMEDDQVTTFVEVEQLEYRIKDGKESLSWDAQAWVGGDYHKLWFKTEGEAPVGERLEEAEFQALYSRLVSDFFDLQVGLRQDFKPEPERTFAVVGLHGLARYFVETDLAAFVSHEGEVSFRAKGEIDLRLTQRLVLQPMAEVNLAVQSVAERHVGSGVNDVELGLRLRYEIAREFAPYIGVNWERKLGETADLTRAEGERVDSFAVVAGLRFWF